MITAVMEIEISNNEENNDIDLDNDIVIILSLL